MPLRTRKEVQSEQRCVREGKFLSPTRVMGDQSENSVDNGVWTPGPHTASGTKSLLGTQAEPGSGSEIPAS